LGSWFRIFFRLENLTERTITINKRYKNKSANVRIVGAIQNPQNMRRTPLDFECRIDTGFDGGILVPHWYRSDAQTIGVEPSITNITLADGSKIPAYVCAAYIHKIDTYTFPPPGKTAILVMCGNRKRELLGMDALKHCSVLFDGPKQTFTISFG